MVARPWLLSKACPKNSIRKRSSKSLRRNSVSRETLDCWMSPCTDACLSSLQWHHRQRYRDGRGNPASRWPAQRRPRIPGRQKGGAGAWCQNHQGTISNIQIILTVKLTRRAGPWVLNLINNAPRGSRLQWTDGSLFRQSNSHTSYLLCWWGKCQSEIACWGVGRYPLNASVVENRGFLCGSGGISQSWKLLYGCQARLVILYYGLRALWWRLSIEAKCSIHFRATAESMCFMNARVRVQFSAGLKITAWHLQTLADILQHLATSKTMEQPGHFPESDVVEKVRYTDWQS